MRAGEGGSEPTCYSTVFWSVKLCEVPPALPVPGQAQLSAASLEGLRNDQGTHTPTVPIATSHVQLCGSVKKSGLWPPSLSARTGGGGGFFSSRKAGTEAVVGLS